MADDLLLALDYGGTKLSAAVAGIGEREWRVIERTSSPPDRDARYDQKTMLTLARRLLQGSRPAALGVSFGGPVDAARGRVILSHHVPGWEDTPLRDQLQDAFGAPASVDNDANAAALGEYKFGAGRVSARHNSPRNQIEDSPSPKILSEANGAAERGVASLFYVTVSTGVGGGWVLDGKIFNGADGVAGEIGHTIAEPDGPPCVCGRRGCVEALACGPAIARAARARLIAEPNAGAGLRALVGGDLDAVTSAEVARAATDGDELAQQVMEGAARALGFGIGTAITLMNPERVVVGGGVAKSGARYFDGLRAAARANTLPQMRVDIVPAALRDDAPLWGAIALAESLLQESRMR